MSMVHWGEGGVYYSPLPLTFPVAETVSPLVMSMHNSLLPGVGIKATGFS